MSWFLLKRDATVDCINLKKIWNCCIDNQISPQECPSQEALEIKSSSSTFSSSSGTASCSSTTLTKEEDNHWAEESFDNLVECIKLGEKGFQNKIKNNRFLHKISNLCTMGHLPYRKENVVQDIMMLMADIPDSKSMPDTTLISGMYAIRNLSKIKPPFLADTESRILKVAIQGILSVDEEVSSHSQALYKSSSDTLIAMLKGFLEEEPTTRHLLFILEHVNFWIKSSNRKERARAQKISTGLLQHAVLVLHFDDSDNLPLLGHHVAELALCLTDHVQEVREQAREGLMCLYNMLQHRNELMTETPWCQKRQKTKEMIGCRDACKVGQMFAKVFNEQQRRSFLQTLWLRSHDSFIRDTAVLLIYSLMGRHKELLGKEVLKVRGKIMKAFDELKKYTEVAELLEYLHSKQDSLTLEDMESTDEEI